MPRRLRALFLGGARQTQSTGLPHPSFNHCRIYLRHRSQKPLWCSNSSKLVTNNSNYIRRLFCVAMLLTPAQLKPKSVESRRNSFLPGVDASHVYVRAWALGCFHSHIRYPNLSEGADHVGGELCGDKEYPFSGVTKSGRVWGKVPESDARSVRVSMSATQPGRTTVCVAAADDRLLLVLRFLFLFVFCPELRLTNCICVG